MKTYLITGCSGFVGGYLIDYIASCEPDAKIVGVDRSPIHNALPPAFSLHKLNLLDADAVARLVGETQPDFLVHLASYSSVAYSWHNPIESFKNNTNIFLNLLEAVRNKAPTCRVLSVGSSEEYGIVSESETPLREEQPLRPASPYAAARVAQEHLSGIYAKGFRMDIVCTRSFNHVGPGQSDMFVVSSLARNFVEFKAGRRSCVTVGDTGIIRDFLDVRDVVRAYHVLLKKGKSGEAYNVSSGHGFPISAIITILAEITGSDPPVEVDTSLLRPVENRVVIGSYEKIFHLTGWRPQIGFKEALGAVVRYWQDKMSAVQL